MQYLIQEIKFQSSSIRSLGESYEIGNASEGGGNLSGGVLNLPSRKNLVSNKPIVSSIYINELKKDEPSKTYEQNNIFFYKKDADKDNSLDIENTMKTTTNKHKQIREINNYIILIIKLLFMQ